MIVRRQPLSPVARVVAWLFASVCVAAGSMGLALGIARHQVSLTIAAAGMLGLGVLYAGAAWRGRPWPFR